MAEQQRELSGWLSKLASSRVAGGPERWQRRWFLLDGDLLKFFNSQAEATSTSNATLAKWTLDLGVGASARMEAEAGRFVVHAAGDTYAFKADTDVEAEMWVCALPTQPRGQATPHGSAALSHGAPLGAMAQSIESRASLVSVGDATPIQLAAASPGGGAAAGPGGGGPGGVGRRKLELSLLLPPRRCCGGAIGAALRAHLALGGHP